MKIKLLSLILLFIIIPSVCFCQWQVTSKIDNVSGLGKIYFTNSHTGFTTGDNKIYRTTNSGENWNLVYQQGSDGIYDIEFINHNTGFACYDMSIFLKTTNGGLNWETRNMNQTFTSIFFFNENVGYLTTFSQSRLWKTTNGGVNWNAMSYSFPFISLNDVKFLNNDTGFVCGSELGPNNRPYLGKTTNGGITFMHSWLITGHTLSFVNTQTGYLCNNVSLYKTTNGGPIYPGGWITTGSFSAGGIKVSTIDSNFVYVSGGGGFFSKSENGGATWSQMYSPVRNNIYDLFFINKDTGFACGDSGVVLRIINASTVGVNNISNEIPSDFKLHQNYPNPFNPTTIINYQLPKFSNVSLKVYDILGNEVVTLVNEKQNAGIYEAEFDGSGLASGIYFYRIDAGEFIQTKRMTLVK
ncbi:MAG: YCF48-related protein [bacterium]